jgi:hypothetical protein
MKTQNTYGSPSIGCYLDQSYCNACEHDGRTVRLAMEYGFQPSADDFKLLARLDNDVLSDERDDAQCLSELADEAIDWLNSQETRPFLYWANDGEANAFGLWPSVESAKEDVGFMSGQKEDASEQDSDYPADDYRGEWLHVSDHGNCTLYVREDAPSNPNSLCAGPYFDREIWSVV